VLQGYILLAVQAHVPALHPAPCVGTEQTTSICEPLHGSNLSFLYLGLYLITIGDGAARACLPASTWRRAIRYFRPRGAAAGGELLQLVHLRRVVGRVRRARVHRVGGEQKGMVPRVRCVRPVCAFGHARMDCRVSVLQKSAAWWKSHHKNLAGTVCGALLFNIQVCPLVGLASSPQTTSVDENIETLSGLLYQEIRKPNSSRAEKYLKY
jgi:hypothetical protein